MTVCHRLVEARPKIGTFVPVCVNYACLVCNSEVHEAGGLLFSSRIRIRIGIRWKEVYLIILYEGNHLTVLLLFNILQRPTSPLSIQ
jgi:hypothetical protein